MCTVKKCFLKQLTTVSNKEFSNQRRVNCALVMLIFSCIFDAMVQFYGWFYFNHPWLCVFKVKVNLGDVKQRWCLLHCSSLSLILSLTVLFWPLWLPNRFYCSCQCCSIISFRDVLLSEGKHLFYLLSCSGATLTKKQYVRASFFLRV